MTDSGSTPELFRLDDKVAIVTGAAGLLGEQHAIALAECGAHVALLDLNVEECKKRAALLTERTGVRTIAHRCDVTSRDSWDEASKAVHEQLGRVDVLVNNAAFTNQSRSKNYSTPFEEFPVEDWNQILEVNLTGTFLGCQSVGAKMLEAGSGTIINMGSLYGVVSPNHRMYPGTGIAQPAAYSVSKAGVIALTRYLGTLWADSGIRVNSITPGGIFNEHQDLFLDRFNQLDPMGRMAKKEEMRGALIYLASDASSHCVAHNLIVDGGWTAW